MELQMAHRQDHHQHWSGYNSTAGYYSNGTYHPPAVVGRRSPARSPIILSPSPPSILLSSSPRAEKETTSSSPGGHGSRKLDNIFRHLVKWGSPHHKDKDKDLKQNRASPTRATGSSSGKSTNPIAGNSKPRSSYYDHSERPASSAEHRGYFDDDEEEDEDSNSYDQEDESTEQQNRGRSKSLDLVTARYMLRRRRFSENIPTRVKDTSQTHRTYTIYESIIQDGVWSI